MNASVINPTEVDLSQNQISPIALAELETFWTIEDIQNRAEVITPTMEEILESRPPTRWGINE